MTDIRDEIREFSRSKADERRNAGQIAAFFLVSGIDLEAALGADVGERALIVRRLERLIERERLRGMRRHWSYDLNRHIALKQARDRLRRASPQRQG